MENKFIRSKFNGLTKEVYDDVFDKLKVDQNFN